MLRGIDPKPHDLLWSGSKKRRLNVKQLIELWNSSDCECTKGSSNLACPLNKILYTLRHQRSFATFKKVYKEVGSIARSRPEKQKRKNHLRFISKCLSGPVYCRMDYIESKEIQDNPALYDDSDSPANSACDITEDSATEDMSDHPE
jgi:hypothetical protein